MTLTGLCLRVRAHRGACVAAETREPSVLPEKAPESREWVQASRTWGRGKGQAVAGQGRRTSGHHARSVGLGPRAGPSGLPRPASRSAVPVCRSTE